MGLYGSVCDKSQRRFEAPAAPEPLGHLPAPKVDQNGHNKSISHMVVFILYSSTHSLLNGPPRHLLLWARIPRVCWLGPEPQGTPNHTFLSPNESPWHHLGPGDRARGQNFGANLGRGVPPPQSQLFLFTILEPRNAELSIFVKILKMDCPSHGGFAFQTPQSRLLWLG